VILAGRNPEARRVPYGTMKGALHNMRNIRRNLIGLGLATLMTVTLGAQQKGKKGQSLYERLGGKPAITAVVDEFVARVAADTKINRYFAAAASDPARLASFKGKLVDQICQASGGPCTYTGKNMKEAHAGMGITGAEVDAVVVARAREGDQFK